MKLARVVIAGEVIAVDQQMNMRLVAVVVEIIQAARDMAGAVKIVDINALLIHLPAQVEMFLRVMVIQRTYLAETTQAGSNHRHATTGVWVQCNNLI